MWVLVFMLALFFVSIVVILLILSALWRFAMGDDD